ncbi:MAG TPA: T9SS type A sorting domain-containing protein [Candidatus Acidoferrales bacterium]|nr:T9SS type A sorting domain-containing protein [Candidatus Acidoferrales bacterium]
MCKIITPKKSWIGFFIFIAFSFSGNTLAQSPYTWKSVMAGGGGFVPGIIYHPAARGLAYARTDIGGAYRWDNSANRWTPLTDLINRNSYNYALSTYFDAKDNTTAGVLSLALDSKDTNRVYLETGQFTQSWVGNGALLSSTDRGNTWKIISLPFKIGANEDGRGCGERLQVDPNDDSILFMGTSSNSLTSPSQAGLWKSTNFGATWSSLSSFTPTNVNFVLLDPSSSSPGNPTKKIFVSAADTSGKSLYVSTDGGSSWTVVVGQPHGAMAIRAAISGSLLYMTFANYQGPDNATAGSVWKYNIGNGSWTNITPTPAPPAQGGYSGISLYPKNPNYIIVSTLDRWYPKDEVYLSTDGGSTWVGKLGNANLDYSYAPYVSNYIGGNPSWLACVSMDPFDSSKVMLAGAPGVWACDNIFASTPTWYFKDENLEETVVFQIVSPQFTNLLSVMEDIDGFRHDNLDVSPPQGRWNPPKNTEFSIASAGNVPSKLVKAYLPGFVGAYNPAPYGAYSTDGGTTWNDFTGYPAGAVAGASWGQLSICISADGSTIVWSPAGASASYSADDGKTWTSCGGGVPDSVQPKADPVNPKKFYILDAISSGQIWISTDGGKTFLKGAGGLPTVPFYQSEDERLTTVPGHEGDLWICTGSNGLYHSLNSGSSASKVSSVGTAWLLGVGKASTPGGYPALYLWGIVNGILGIFRSDNSGATWTRINDDGHQFGYLLYVTGDPRVYGRCYISSEGRGILYGESANTDTTDNPTTFNFSPGPSDSLRSYYQNITASWSNASDPQGKTLTYIMHLFGPAVDTTFKTTNSSTSFSVGTIQPSNRYVLTGYASNGFDTTASANAIWFNTASIISGLSIPQKPILVSPAHGAVNQLPNLTLRINQTAGAIGYHWQVSINPGFSTTTINDSTSGTGDTANSVTLNAGTMYYWHVRALNAAGASAFSNLDSFSVMAIPAVPVLSSPVGGISSVPRATTFKWNRSANATKYRLQAATDNAFSGIVFDTTTADSSKKLSNPLTAKTTYYWRVNASDTIGASAYSIVALFTTGTGVDAIDLSGIPKEYALSQNYPDPFNPSTIIDYQLPVNGRVTLKVYDVLGREVETLVNEFEGPGKYEVRFDGARFSSGVYFYTLNAGTFLRTKKLVLLK